MESLKQIVFYKFVTHKLLLRPDIPFISQLLLPVLYLKTKSFNLQ